jgi:hypothetical protein
MSKTSLIKITYKFNEDITTISFDPNNKLSVLKQIITLSLKINFSEYNLIYNKTKLNDIDITLREITGNDKNPLFTIKKKSKYFKYNLQ